MLEMDPTVCPTTTTDATYSNDRCVIRFNHMDDFKIDAIGEIGDIII